MNKKRLILSLVVVAILILGYVIYPLISPLFIDRKVNEAPLVNIMPNDLPSIDQAASSSDDSVIVYAQGNFTGFDRIHTGTGTVQLITKEDSYIVRFEPDFSVQNGPDLYIGFGKDGKYIEGSEISTLKGNIGSQNYVVEGKFDAEKYNEVWIWCKQFSTPFARAILKA